MKNIFTCLTLLLIAIAIDPCFAQQAKIDSLVSVLKDSKEDSNKVKTLVALTEKTWRTGDYQKAMLYAENGRKLSEKIQFKKGIGNTLALIGIIYYLQGENTKALDYSLRVLKIREELNDKKGIANLYSNIALIYTAQDNIDKTLEYNFKALKTREELGDKDGIAMSLSNIGIIYTKLGDYPKALDMYSRLVKEREKQAAAYASPNDESKTIKLSAANAMSDMGVVYMYQGNYPKALSQYFNALKIQEEILNSNAVGQEVLQKTKIGLSSSLSNIGIIYVYQGDNAKSLEYNAKSFKLKEEIGDKIGMANSLNSAGLVYQNMHDSQKALEHFMKSLKLYEEAKDKEGIGANLLNIGSIYDNMGDKSKDAKTKSGNYKKAEEYYLQSVKVGEESGNRRNVSSSFINLGILNTKAKKFTEARKYLSNSLSIAKEIGGTDEIKNSYKNLSLLDSAEGNWKSSLTNYKQYILYRDSLLNEENTKKSVRAEMNYAFDKKELASKMEQERKDAISAAESKKQRVIIWSVCGILLLVLAFAVFAYRSYLQKQKANLEITAQKEMIEEKQKEILDSIYYARRIQTALLPNEKYIQRKLTN